MSTRVFCLALSSFFAAACVAAVALHTATPPKQLRMSFEFKESTFTLHEPVILLFTVHNGLDQPVVLDLGVNKIQSFEFVLISPQGQTIQGRPQLREGLGTLGVLIEPGEDYQQEPILNQWFEFGTPGKFILTARLNTPLGMDGATLPAQRLQLEIKPRDIQRLTKVCTDLARQVEEAPNAEAAQEPALVLSYVEDPIAVPYLAQVLSSHKLTDHLVIPGLERIGSDDAIKALLSALDDKFGETADLARQALTRMEDRISDPVLKETVRRALAPTPTD
jgi:hypothetical protein